MCNRARLDHDPETLRERFGAKWLAPRPLENTFDWKDLAPNKRAYVVREDERGRGIDLMPWDVLRGQASWAMTNVRDLDKPQWRALASDPANRCLVPLTEFCEWTKDKIDLGDGKPPLKGEMWFQAADQHIFAVAGFWQRTIKGNGFAMMTCDPNELVAPIHPKSMVTILRNADWDRWMTCDYAGVVELQRPYPARKMTVRGPEFPTRMPAAEEAVTGDAPDPAP